MAQYNWLQVKSTQQYLNIYNGDFACQGNTPTTDNFLWEIVPAAAPYCMLQVKNSGAYLCLNSAGYLAQGTPPAPTPDTFLWQIVPAGATYFNLQLKSNGMYMGITDANGGNGSPASLGNTPTASNFLWAMPVRIQLTVANGKGSANPEEAIVVPGNIIVWSLTGARWPAAANSGVSFPNVSTLFPGGLSFVSNMVQGTLNSNLTTFNTDYPYTVNPVAGVAEDDVMMLDFIDEDGLGFDPKIKIKMPVKP